MKHSFKHKFLLVGLLTLFSNNLFAQGYGDILGQHINIITTAVPFLMIAPDARAGALGDAGVSSAPDIYSMHWNPAKYAFLYDEKFWTTDSLTGDTTTLYGNTGGVSLNYTQLLRILVSDVNLYQFTGVWRPDKKQALAFSMKCFSSGDVIFTDEVGNPMGTIRPREFAIDASYSRKFGGHFSGAFTARFIHSDLTRGHLDGIEPKSAIAFDLSSYYQRPVTLFAQPVRFAAGIHVSNIGNKISYADEVEGDFLPINLRLGPSLTFQINKTRSLAIMLDLNKLLVPTPPIYARNQHGQIIFDDQGNPVIESGRDPNRSVISGMFGSFNDAPGGFSEELREITVSTGIEYQHNDYVILRGGYFYEHEMKGNRKYITLGAGGRYKRIGLDVSMLHPGTERSPTARTFRFSLMFFMDNLQATEII